jgi:hypothetical protein
VWVFSVWLIPRRVCACLITLAIISNPVPRLAYAWLLILRLVKTSTRTFLFHAVSSITAQRSFMGIAVLMAGAVGPARMAAGLGGNPHLFTLLAPTSSFMPIIDPVAERRVYFAMIGPL